MDYSSSLSPSSVPLVSAINSNGNIEDNKSGREAAASSPSAVQAVSSALGTMDDLALSVVSGLAKEARLLFQSGKYSECVNVLSQLLQKKENDPKVNHNIIIAESFQDGCSDPKNLLDKLNDLKKRWEELSLSSEEQTVGNTWNTVFGRTKETCIMTRHSFGTSSSPAVCIDKLDTSVAMFNIAVIWFHLHEYAKSFSILDRLYQNIEPIDEATALRICLFMLDVGLLSNQFSRCADVISYMERVFFINTSPNQVDNGNLAHRNAMIFDSLTPDAHLLESSLARSLSEEGLEDESLQLLSSLDISRQNLQRTRGYQSSQSEDSISTIGLRLKLYLYKVRFLLTTRNFKAAKREVKMAMNMARGKDHTMALYLKSQLEYARMNHQKAIKLLVASINRPETGISSIFLNNLGCIYLRIGKFHTSSVLFSKALSSSSSFLRKEKPPKLSTISQDKSLQIMYNCGVNYLACGKPFPAVRCFQKASVVFYNRPLLWLKIAECCLLALEKGLISASDVFVHVIGRGKWRHLSLENGVSRNVRLDATDNISDNNKQPNLSLTYARQCLLNALHLLEDSDSKRLRSGLVNKVTEPVGSGHASVNGDTKELKSGLNMPFMNSISEYEDFCSKRNQMIKQAVLADLAFVELELENPMSALSTAKSLLKLPECSRVYVFLGNLYAAEALCKLNRLKEASEHLYTYVTASDNNSVELPYSEYDRDKWGVQKTIDSDEPNGSINSKPNESEGSLLKPVDARGTLYANLAVVYVMKGDVDQAQQAVKQALSIIPNYPEVVITAIYLDLLQGKTHDAIGKLKECNRISFVPCNPLKNGSSS